MHTPCTRSRVTGACLPSPRRFRGCVPSAVRPSVFEKRVAPCSTTFLSLWLLPCHEPTSFARQPPCVLQCLAGSSDRRVTVLTTWTAIPGPARACNQRTPQESVALMEAPLIACGGHLMPLRCSSHGRWVRAVRVAVCLVFPLRCLSETLLFAPAKFPRLPLPLNPFYEGTGTAE